MTRAHRKAAGRWRGATAGLVSALVWAGCSSSHPSANIDNTAACPGCDGSVAAGSVPTCGPCETSSVCAPGLTCSGERVCALACSATKACPLGLPCNAGLCSCSLEGGTDAAGDAQADSTIDTGGAPTPAGLVQITTAAYVPTPPPVFDSGTAGAGDDAGSAESGAEASVPDDAGGAGSLDGGDASSASEGGDETGAAAPTGIATTLVVAQFTAAGGPCLPTTTAGCQVFTCFGEPAPGPVAGPITVTGGSAPGGGIVLMVGAAGTYTPYEDGTSNDFPAQTLITITAAGSAVPAFTTTVVASSDVTMMSVPTQLDRQQGGPLTWAIGDAGMVGTLVATLTVEHPSLTIECSAPIAAGGLTIPSALLLGLPTGQEASLQIRLQNEVTLTAGTTPITARHVTIAHTPTGDQQPPVAVTLIN